jgi:branched-chain amino acid transport system substrate-binding protein
MKYLCLSLALVLLQVSATATAESRKWRIGVLAPLSGDVSTWGIDTQRAVELANEMLGEGQFEITFEDDMCLGKNAVTGAQKLITENHIDFAMIVCTEPTLSTAPVFERNKVVVVAPGATGAIISNAGDYIFRTWPSDGKMVEAILNYITSKYSRPASITETRGLPQEFIRVFLQIAGAKSVPVIAEDFSSAETDFRSLILRVKSKNPDVLLLNTDSERTLLALVKQIEAIKWKIPLVGQYVAGTPGFYSKAGSAAEGLVFGDLPAIDCSKERPGCAVYSEFVRRYGPPQSSEFMIGSSIASFMAIAEAARSGKSPKDHLYKTTLDTVIGKISFDSNGDVVGPRHELKVINQGKPRAFATAESLKQ